MKVMDYIKGTRGDHKRTLDNRRRSSDGFFSPMPNKDGSPIAAENEYEDKFFSAEPGRGKSVRTNGLTFDYEDIDNL